MNKIKKVLIVALAMAASACTYENVPQGTKGKILDPSGFHSDVYPPSRVDVGRRGTLVLVETTTQTINEQVTIRMKDNMDLVAHVRFQLRMGEKQDSLNSVFNDIKPDSNLGSNSYISLNAVYKTYGKMIVNKVAREVLSKYAIGDVQANFSLVSANIYKQVQSEFKPTPLIISNVALGKLQYPQVINDAILAAAKRKLDIKQAEANVLVKITELKGQEQIAKGQYRIKMMEAKRIRDYNKMIAQGITPQLLKLRELEVQESMVSTIDKGDTVFFPYGALNSPGMNMRTFSK